MTSWAKENKNVEKIIRYISDAGVACSGEIESSHPLVYLDLQKDGRVSCPYCGVIFVHRGKIDDPET